MESNTQVPARGFWVPHISLIGTGDRLYSVVICDPNHDEGETVYLVQADYETQAEEIAEAKAIEDDIYGEEYGKGDFDFITTFIGNAIK